MILRILATLILLFGTTASLVQAEVQGLNTLTEAQIEEFIKTDQELSKEKQNDVYRYQDSGNQIAANRTEEEIDTINSRLRDYNRELDRRKSITHNTAVGSPGAYGPGTTTTETVNKSRSETTRQGYGGGGQVWVAPTENRGGYNVGTEVYQNSNYSAGPGGVQSGYSRSSVTTNEDGSTVSESEFYKVGVQNTQKWVQTGGGGNNMPSMPSGGGGGGGGGYAPGGPGGLGLAPQGENIDYGKPDDGEEHEKKDGPEAATIDGELPDPGFKDPGKCDGGVIFCGIGLKEGANFTGETLEKRDVGITTNVNMKKLIIGWIKFFLGFVAVIAVIALIYAGILMIVHLGDDGQLEKAKKIIIWAVVGIVLVFLAFAIVNTLTILGDPKNSSEGDNASTQKSSQQINV